MIRLMTFLQTPCTNTIPCKHHTNTIQTPYKHHTNATKTPCKHHTNAIQTPYKHHTNTIQNNALEPHHHCNSAKVFSSFFQERSEPASQKPVRRYHLQLVTCFPSNQWGRARWPHPNLSTIGSHKRHRLHRRPRPQLHRFLVLPVSYAVVYFMFNFSPLDPDLQVWYSGWWHLWGFISKERISSINQSINPLFIYVFCWVLTN